MALNNIATGTIPVPSAAALKDAIRQALKSNIEAAGLNIDEISDDQDLIASGVLDSYGLIELIVEIESKYSLDADLNNARITNAETADFVPSINRLVTAFLINP